MRTRWVCQKCRAVLESKHVHDFQQCACGEFVDGCTHYIRRTMGVTLVNDDYPEDDANWPLGLFEEDEHE